MLEVREGRDSGLRLGWFISTRHESPQSMAVPAHQPLPELSSWGSWLCSWDLSCALPPLQVPAVQSGWHLPPAGILAKATALTVLPGFIGASGHSRKATYKINRDSVNKQDRTKLCYQLVSSDAKKTMLQTQKTLNKQYLWKSKS